MIINFKNIIKGSNDFQDVIIWDIDFLKEFNQAIAG